MSVFDKENIFQFINKHKETLLGLLVIFFIHLKITYNITDVSDIVLADESGYLFVAIKSSVFSLPTDGWVYYLWLKILALFVADPINIYILNNALLIGLPAYLIFLILNKEKRSLFMSVPFACIWMISRINIELWPFISRFALLAIFVTIYFSLFFCGYKRKFIVYMIGSLVVSYIRPEFTPTFIVFLIINLSIVVVALVRDKKWSGIFSSSALMVISALLIFLLIGNPMQKNRSVMAFGQHFSLNFVAEKGSGINPWTNWEEIIENEFGTKESVYKIFIGNHSRVLWHIKKNIRNIWANIFLVILPRHTDAGVLVKALKLIEKIILLWLLFVFGRYIYFIYNKKIKLVISERVSFALFVLIMSIPSLLSILIIYPRMHYIYLFVGVCFVLVAYSIGYGIKVELKTSAKWVASGCAMLLMWYISPYQLNGSIGFFPDERSAHLQTTCSNISYIKKIRALNIDEKVNLLTTLMAINTYLPSNYNVISEFDKKSGYIEFMEETKVNMVHINQAIMSDHRFVDDGEFQSFVKRYRKYGYDKVSLENCEGYFLVNKKLLNNSI